MKAEVRDPLQFEQYQRGRIIHFNQQLDVLRQETEQQDLPNFRPAPFLSREVVLPPKLDFAAFWNTYVIGPIDVAYRISKTEKSDTPIDPIVQQQVTRYTQALTFFGIGEWCTDEERVMRMSPLEQASTEAMVRATMAFEWSEHPEKFERLRFAAKKIGTIYHFLATGENTEVQAALVRQEPT